MDEEKVKLLVEKGENMELDYLLSCTTLCEPFLKDEEWNKLEKYLKEAIDKKYPGAVDWDLPFPALKDGFDNPIVPDDIKEKYIRCFLYTKDRL